MLNTYILYINLKPNKRHEFGKNIQSYIYYDTCKSIDSKSCIALLFTLYNSTILSLEFLDLIDIYNNNYAFPTI